MELLDYALLVVETLTDFNKVDELNEILKIQVWQPLSHVKLPWSEE